MSGTEKNIRQEVFFTGRVQGVGFRYTTSRIAGDFSVTGFVRNLADGRVHLVAEGTPREITRFIAAIEEQMRGNIQHADKSIKTEGTGEFDSFGVQY